MFSTPIEVEKQNRLQKLPDGDRTRGAFNGG